MDQICNTLNTTVRMKAFRYLQELGYLTGYTHIGKYHTLPNIVQFDVDGFWRYGDIGFSIHGTLINTLHLVITASESEKSNSDWIVSEILIETIHASQGDAIG